MALPAQSWNNVLSYIKLGLGAPLNLIEIPDSEIIEMLKEHVLPVFSQYSPLQKWAYVGPEHMINDKNIPGQPLYKFKIPKEIDEPIVDILEVIFGPYSILTQEYGMIPYNTMGAIDLVIANSYADAIRSLQTRNTWNFIPPDTLILDLSLDESGISGGAFAVVNYTTIHKTLDTIEPDFYNLAFKKMCLGQVMVWLAAMRGKYENLATPLTKWRIKLINLI